MKSFVVLALILASCAQKALRPGEWNTTVYFGSSKNQAIYQPSSGDVVKCKSPDFDTFVCLTFEEYNRLLIGLSPE